MVLDFPKENGKYEIATSLFVTDYVRKSTKQSFKYKFTFTIESNSLKSMTLNFILWCENSNGDPIYESFETSFINENEFVEKINATLLLTNYRNYEYNKNTKCQYVKLL